MVVAETVMMIAALVCFVCGALGVRIGDLNTVAAGLALWVATLIF